MLRNLKRLFKSKEAYVSVYKRDNGYILHANKLSTDGVWISTEPCVKLDLETEKEEIGRKVIDLLKESEGRIEHPTEFKGLFNFVLKVAQVRSYKKFMEHCIHCGVFLKGKVITFMPYKNDNRKGFEQITEESESIKFNSQSDEYGKTLFNCLRKCK